MQLAYSNGRTPHPPRQGMKCLFLQHLKLSDLIILTGVVSVKCHVTVVSLLVRVSFPMLTGHLDFSFHDMFKIYAHFMLDYLLFSY